MNENLAKIIDLSEYEFHNLKIDNSSDKLEINEKGITFIFGGNGVGKTTISKTIYENNINSFHYFSYEDNHEMLNDKLIIAKNQSIISKLGKEVDNMTYELKSNINNLFKNILNISSGSPIYKYFLKEKEKNIFKNEFVVSKNTKNIDYDFLNVDKLETIKKKLCNKKDLNKLLYLIDKFKNLSKDEYFNINDLYNELLNLKNEKKKIVNKFNEKISELAEKNQIYFLKNEILNLLNNKDINLNQIKKCIICDREIHSWKSIIQEIENDINEYNKCLKDEKYLEKINNFINSSNLLKKALDINSNSSSPKLLNLFFDKHDFLLEETEKLKNEFDEVIYLIETEISSFFIKKRNNIEFIDDLINKLKEKKKLENEQDINKDIEIEYELVYSYIREKIGEDRIKINTTEKAIVVDGFKINNDSDMQKSLSTGERKFITFCFSLIFYILENNDKTIIIDDPYCSYDSSNEYNIIYIINYLANVKKIKFLIFTHSWNYLSSQTMSELLDNEKKRKDFYYIIEKTLFNNENNVFVKKLCEIKNKKDLNNVNCLFSNNHFLDWIRKQNKQYLKSYIENEKNFNFKQYALFLFSILPIIRGYLKIIDINKKRNVLNKLMHYCNETFYIKDDDENKVFIFDLLKLFWIDYEGKKINIEEKLLNKTIEKMFKMKLDKFIGIELNKWNDVDSIIKIQLNKLLNILILRKKLEYILLKKIYQTSEINFCILKNDKIGNEINIYSLLGKCENKISKKNSMLIKSKRIFINGFTHLERLNNYIIPLFELTSDLLDKNEKFIKEIEGENL